jgi:serine/threonine protein kinase
MAPPATCPRCAATLDPASSGGLCPRCLLERARPEPEIVFTSAGRPQPEPPSIEELAPHFPGYEILERIGQGGMGAVYRARQKGLGREVALKVLRADVAETPGFAGRFEREARTLAGLRHPGIVTVYDSGRAGPWFYIAMELVDGVDLRRLLRARELGPREALSIVIQVSEALQHAHDAGVVHRDIKPENILVDAQGRVRILDFGLAKLVGAAGPAPVLTRTQQVMGTPHYMAPEQWERPLAVDHRADIFSLGVVFYELLTGELPVGRFAPPSQRVALDVRLDDVVLRALEREPERRYQRAGEVGDDVDRIRAQGGPAAGDAAPAVPVSRAKRPFPIRPPAASVPLRDHAEADRRADFTPKLLMGALLVLYALMGLAALYLFLRGHAPVW